MVTAIFINAVPQFARPPEHQERRIPACLYVVERKESSTAWLKAQECISPLGTCIDKGCKRPDLLEDAISPVTSTSQSIENGPFQVCRPRPRGQLNF
jgi:hypothetical protein